jgi:predicted TPR repeat methyltransferase
MDVLCYFGDLTDIFRDCRSILRNGGIFALSVEKPDSDDDLWQLHPYGHFVHSLRHLREAATYSGFEELHAAEMVLRCEVLEERVGYICLYRRRD